MNQKCPSTKIVSIAASETTKVIINDLNQDLFAILIDESRDVSVKERMAVVLRYVNSKGRVIERFLGINHVLDTTALSLKTTLDSMLCRYSLSIANLRGQGYDGASNMSGDINGLKTLIQKENSSAFYVHCFAHQLQLTLVAVAQNDLNIASFFSIVANVTNVVGASCKRRDVLRQKQSENLEKALSLGEAFTGQGQNQETTLKRVGDTRWSSHYGSICNLLLMFPSVLEVLQIICEDSSNLQQRVEADALLVSMRYFDFIFNLHLMETILTITNDLSQALQRKDQDTVNAMKLVTISKKRLQMLRDEGWEDILTRVSSFCEKHEVEVPVMDGKFVACGRSRRNVEETTNLYHYCVDRFYYVIDMQLQDLNSRFNDTNTELLLCMSCLDPSSSFRAFDEDKLIRFASFYPSDFSPFQLLMLKSQLQNYIIDMRSIEDFSDVRGIGSLAETLVDCNKHVCYPLVFLLIKLSLILPVATASVERSFSAMNIIKTRLRNRLGDDLANDCLVTYIEKDIFQSIEDESILRRFQNMCRHRGTLK